MRVLIAGFQHETNTFAPSKADWAAFNRNDGMPGFRRGQAVLDTLSDVNIPIAGFIQVAVQNGWSVKPSFWAGATPSAHVTEDAFERISEVLMADAAARDFDAIYLDLHGAAVAEHVDDCEGELLERLRKIVGPQMPIVVSLDSHANMTARMFKLADALTCYRTYPHIDMAATGERAGHLLSERIKRGSRQPTYVRRLPFLLSLNSQSTMTEPNQSFTAALTAHDNVSRCNVNFATGFPAADFPECGPVLWGHGEEAKAVIDQFADQLIAQRAQWRLRVEEANSTVRRALELIAKHGPSNGKPVVIADTQDNPGAGGDSNTTGFLHALLDERAGEKLPGQVAIGLIFDPQSALAAHQSGLGTTVELGVGKSIETGWAGLSEPPVRRSWKVVALSDGHVTLEGPMMKNAKFSLGPCATLEHAGIKVCVVSGKKQMLDLALYRFLGVEPTQMKLLVNKSSVHFRAAFTPIAAEILVGKAPGPMAANPADLPWKHLPQSMAREP